MAFKLGKDAKLYQKAGGYLSGGSWVEVTNVKDNEVKLTKERADVSTRGNAGWKAEVAAQKSCELNFQMVHDTADASYVAFRDSYFNDTVLGIKTLDAAGGQGIQFDAMVVDFSKGEPLAEAQMTSVTIVPTYSVNPPQII